MQESIDNEFDDISDEEYREKYLSDQVRLLTYEDWYNLNEDTINIELAETGADREMDFDSEREFERRYLKYMKDNGYEMDDQEW